jgi:hypothetical protein
MSGRWQVVMSVFDGLIKAGMPHVPSAATIDNVTRTLSENPDINELWQTLSPYPRLLAIPPQMYGVPRSPHWEKLEHEVKADHPYCAACDETEHDGLFLQVHHIKGFVKHPELELVRKNLIVLCLACHWEDGHLRLSWHETNSKVEEVSAIKLEQRREARKRLAA